MSDLEFNFSNASDFEKKNSKRVRFWLKSFTKRQVLDSKNYDPLDFALKNFGHVRFWKIVCIQKIVFWFNLIRENDLFCIFFWCFSKERDFELKISKRVRFWFKIYTTRQIWDWKKYIFKVVLNASFFHFKKIKHVRYSVKILQPLRDELTCGSFQLYIGRLNLNQTLSFNFLP